MTVPVKIVSLIAARNGVRDAMVKLRGGHAAASDDADLALAALDIAIGKVGIVERPKLGEGEGIAALREALQNFDDFGNDCEHVPSCELSDAVRTFLGGGDARVAAPQTEDRELLDAAKAVLKQFDFIKRVQHNELVKGQTLESASKNWEGLGNEFIDFQPLIDAVAKAEQRAEGATLPAPPQGHAFIPKETNEQLCQTCGEWVNDPIHGLPTLVFEEEPKETP